MRQLMNCPACGETMISELFGSAWIEVCRSGCHGLWFDHGELAKLDARDKGAGPALQEALREAPSERPAELTYVCPLCTTTMGRFRHELAPEVEYDECPACYGLFLRAGELGRLRRREESPAERSARRMRERRARKRALERARQQDQATGIGMAAILAAGLLD